MQVAFAPVSGSDRPIFATVTSYDFPSLSDRRPRPTTDHIRSIGVVVSRDGGVTWQPTPGQPEIDGIPFRHIRDLVVSPTYGQDQTLVVFAWGPSEPTLRGPLGQQVKPSGLFLSADSGASWSVVWQPEGNLTPGPSISSPYASSLQGRVALSTTFAQDRAMILNFGGGLSPAGSFCEVRLSADAAQSWRQIASRQGYDSGATCFSYPGGMAGYAGRAGAQTSLAGSTGTLFMDSDGWVQGLPQMPTLSPSPRG